MKNSWFKKSELSLQRSILTGNKPVAAACLLVLVAGCSSNSEIHHDQTTPLEWDIDAISTSTDADVRAGDLPGDLIGGEMIAQTDVPAGDYTPMPAEAVVKVAAIEPPKVKKPIIKSRQIRKKRPVTMPNIEPSACADPFSGQDKTISLATTADLKLRQGPSTSAATISVFAEGTMLTARKLSCGNWTEIVSGKRTIGYVHSYFLTTPGK